MRLRKSTGLVTDLRMREGSGAVVGDASRYGNHGAVNGGCAWGERGMRFDGSSGYVDCGNDGSLNPSTGDISFSAWVNTVAISGYILAKAEGENRYFLGMTGTGEIRFQLKDAALQTVYIITDESWNDGTWHHVFVTIDRDVVDGAKICIDGNIEKTGDPTAVGNVNPSTNLCIGSWTGGSTNLNATIDHPRVWNRALSAREIMKQYETEKPLYL